MNITVIVVCLYIDGCDTCRSGGPMRCGWLFWTIVLVFFVASLAAFGQQPASAPARPNIRTVTAFIRMDRQNYKPQVADAVKMLNAAKAEFVKAGYVVETIRITTQPFPEITRGLTSQQALEFFQEYDKLAQKEGFTPDIGAAMMKDTDDPAQADLLAKIIETTETINGFVLVADDQGIHWNAVRAAARVVKHLEEHTTHSEGNFRFAPRAFPPAIAPFFPVSHTSGAGHQFAVGMESANIAQQAFSSPQGGFAAAGDKLSEALGSAAGKVEEIAHRIESQSGWKYEGIELTPVPRKEISIGPGTDSVIGNPIGSPGSLSAALVITTAVHKVKVKQAGYSGLMLPGLEDGVLAKRWEAGTINRDSLMSYSSVCSTGLDAIPLPGDVTGHDRANIIGRVARRAVQGHKPLPGGM